MIDGRCQEREPRHAELEAPLVRVGTNHASQVQHRWRWIIHIQHKRAVVVVHIDGRAGNGRSEIGYDRSCCNSCSSKVAVGLVDSTRWDSNIHQVVDVVDVDRRIAAKHQCDDDILATAEDRVVLAGITERCRTGVAIAVRVAVDAIASSGKACICIQTEKLSRRLHSIRCACKFVRLRGVVNNDTNTSIPSSTQQYKPAQAPRS